MANPFFSPDGEWIGFYDGQLKKIRTSGGTPVVIAAGVAIPQGASWSPDGARVVFGQPTGIMEVSANGGTPSLVVAADADLWDPQVLPDGSLIYTRFTAAQTGEIMLLAPGSAEPTALFPGGRAIYVPSGHLIMTDPAAAPNTLFARTFDFATHETGAPALVAENVLLRASKTHYAISNNGTLVYVYGEPTAGAGGSSLPELYLTLVDREGDSQRLAAPPRPYRSPRVSPDATRVAVEVIGNDQRSSIWVYDLAGDTDIRRLTQVNEGDNLRPVWTLDGERLTFSSDRDGTASIYWQPADGSGPAERLTTAEQGTLHLPESWSPDGSLSFALLNGGFGAAGWGIWTRDPDGETSVFHSLDTSNQFGSAFSPDGRWLAYTSGEASTDQGQFRIYAEQYPKSGVRHEIVGGGATWPVWSKDGAELFYRRGFAAESRLLNSVAVLDSGPGFRFTTGDSVAIRGFTTHQNYRDFDPLPDGSGWLMLTSTSEAEAASNTAAAEPDRINVVLNWFQELKERVPTE